MSGIHADDGIKVMTMEEVMALPPEPPRWGGWVLHKHSYELYYAPFQGTPYVYPIDLETFTTSARVLDMIMQVAGKTWATDECLAGLVRAINDILVPQGTLCSNGRSKALESSEIRSIIDRRS